MRILITGCTGTLGKALVDNYSKSERTTFGIRNKSKCDLQSDYHDCISVDLMNYSEVHELDLSLFDTLIHTSWLTTPDIFWNSDVNIDWRNASISLFERFVEFGGKRIVGIGSCAEYDWSIGLPLAEDSPVNDTSMYAKSKLEVLAWLRQQKVEYLWLRIFFMFGGSEPYGRLIPSTIDSLLAGDNFEVQNSKTVRDFVSVADVARVIHELNDIPAVGVINVGQGVGTDISKVVSIIEQILNKSGFVTFSTSERGGNEVISDSKKLNALLPSFRWSELDEAIRENVMLRRSVFQKIKPDS
jgi:nucleoside-diphosphate-sugar epimerase